MRVRIKIGCQALKGATATKDLRGVWSEPEVAAWSIWKRAKSTSSTP